MEKELFLQGFRNSQTVSTSGSSGTLSSILRQRTVFLIVQYIFNFEHFFAPFFAILTQELKVSESLGVGGWGLQLLTFFNYGPMNFIIMSRLKVELPATP